MGLNMNTIKTQYEELDSNRGVLISRLYDYAELTIPGLLPRTGYTQTQELPIPYTSMPSRGITRLASRMVSALYPLNDIPFFELGLDLPINPAVGQDPKKAYEVLGRIERRVMDKLAHTNLRSALYTAMQHIITIGDCLLEVTDEYTFAIHRIDNYVVRRRPDGVWWDIILRIPVDKTNLPEELIEAGFENDDTGEDDRFSYDFQNDENAIFVHVIRRGDGCVCKREYQGRVYSEYDHDACPFVPLGWNHIPGEDYHRGLIEENWADVRALDGLSAGLLDAVAASAEYRFGVNPAGLAEISDIENTSNGSFVAAAQGDIFGIQLENQAVVAAIQNAVGTKEQALGQMFLLNSAVQPTGERVTATQVRVIASELEQALGGVFGSVSRDFQRPIIKRVMLQMVRDGSLMPEGEGISAEIEKALIDPKSILRIEVRSGLASLNREVENEKMLQIMQVVAQMPPQATQAIDFPNMLERFLQTFGIETAGIIKSQEQMQQEQMQAQQQQVAQAGAEAAAVQAGQQAAPPPQG